MLARNQEALNNKVAYIHSMFFRTVSDLINYPSYFCLDVLSIMKIHLVIDLLSRNYILLGKLSYTYILQRDHNLKEKKCKTIFSMAQGNVML